MEGDEASDLVVAAIAAAVVTTVLGCPEYGTWAATRGRWSNELKAIGGGTTSPRMEGHPPTCNRTRFALEQDLSTKRVGSTIRKMGT